RWQLAAAVSRHGACRVPAAGTARPRSAYSDSARAVPCAALDLAAHDLTVPRDDFPGTELCVRPVRRPHTRQRYGWLRPVVLAHGHERRGAAFRRDDAPLRRALLALGFPPRCDDARVRSFGSDAGRDVHAAR